MKSLEIFTKNNVETKKIGGLLAKETIRSRTSNSNNALVISLEGDLGAGKTTFTQGFARGLGVKEVPKSPTFMILQIYDIKLGVNKNPRSRKSVDREGFKNFIHVDAYRLESKDFKVLNWDNFVKDKKNIILVEWGNKIKNILPKNSLRITFGHIGRSGHLRLIKVYK